MNKVFIRESFLANAKELMGSVNLLDDDVLLCEHIPRFRYPMGAMRMNYTLVALCLKGEATYTIDTKERTVREGDAIIISARHVLDNVSYKDDTEGLLMLMSTEFTGELMKQVNNASALYLFSTSQPVVHLDDKQTAFFRQYFDLLRQKIRDDKNPFRRDVVRTLLLAMLYDIGSVVYLRDNGDAPRQTRAEQLFASFMRLIQENYRRERAVGWYAEQLNITPKYLTEVTKNVSKRTPNEWIDSFVVTEARLLLTNSMMSIKEIADQLNFVNQSFFGKFFRDHVGVSPRTYRNR